MKLESTLLKFWFIDPLNNVDQLEWDES